jgi:thiol-disulfide isomerase/thioredoxin
MIAMSSNKNTNQAHRRYGRVGAGFLVALLFLLAAAGAMSTRLPVASSQGTEESYDLEFHKGLDLLRRRRWDDALKSFKRANDLRNKQSAECFYGMAQAYQGLEAYKNVAESCDKMIEFSAGDTKTQAMGYNLKGIALQAQADIKDQKKLQEAEAAFRQGLALNTDLAILHYNLGFTLLQENRDPEGIAELKKFTELQPEGVKAESALKLIGNPRRAREAFAPDFSITTSAGEYVSLEDLRGKVVLLDFWGTWCPPCVASVPALRDMNKRYAKEKSFVMISVSVHDEPEKWRDFTAKNQMVWPQYFDRDGVMQRAFAVNRFPTYILIDHEGIVRLRVSGMSFEREASLNDAIHKQIKIVAKSAPTE